MGRLATESGDPEGAVAAFRKLLARQPADVEALLGLADALLLAGKTGEAEEAARRALAASPSYWAVHNKLGVVLVSTGRVEEAVAAFRRAVELAPENARCLVNLGSALVLAGRLDEAAGALRRSVAVEPTAEALSALGTVEYYRGRFDEAVAGYEKAVALSPGFSTLWVNLGDARRWSSSARDRAPEAYARAIEAANEELRVNPKDVDAHLALASSFAKTGRPRKAAPHVAAALAARPGEPRRPVPGGRLRGRFGADSRSGRPASPGRAARGSGLADRGGPGAARRPGLRGIPREARPRAAEREPEGR